MLKITYTETGVHLELIAHSLEEFIAQRVMLALRVRGSLVIEPGQAAFLLPTHLPQLDLLRTIAYRSIEGVSLCRSDSDFMEVSLPGTWLSVQGNRSEGVFLATLGEPIEHLVMRLWQAGISRASSLSR